MLQDYKSAIMARISRRSYLDTEVAPATLAVLQEKIAEINAESGLSIAWLENGVTAMAGGKSYGLFRGVRALLLLKGSATISHLHEKIGYYGEQLILEATILGLGTCWVGGTFDATALRVPMGETLVCVVPVGNVCQDNSFKEKFIRHMMHRKSKSIEQLLHSDEPVSEELRDAMELVQRAPTARNMQKVTFAQKNGEITAHVPNNSPFDLVDLGICKLHLECGLGGRFDWGNDAKLCR